MPADKPSRPSPHLRWLRLYRLCIEASAAEGLMKSGPMDPARLAHAEARLERVKAMGEHLGRRLE